LTAILGLVVGARLELCRWCSRPVEAIDVRGIGAEWTQYGRHRCPARLTPPKRGTVLSDLVDEHEMGGI